MPLLHLYLFLCYIKFHFCTCKFSNFHILISLFPCHFSTKQAFSGSSFLISSPHFLSSLLPFTYSLFSCLPIFCLYYFLLHLLCTLSSPISPYFFLPFPLHSLLLAPKRSGPSKDPILFLCTLTSLPAPISLARALPWATVSLDVQSFLQIP